MSVTSRNTTFDLVFMFGPPLFGKVSYLSKSLLRPDYVHLTLSKIFEENPSFGLRDVSLQIISELKKGKQVVIEDELYSANTRKSILCTVKKKVSGCKVVLVKIIPDHGFAQIVWSHQNTHGRDLLPRCCCQNEMARAKRWFDGSLLAVDYGSGYVDAPRENEGFEIKEVQAPFLLQSDFKCEVPALFIQWEAVFSDTGEFNTALVNVCLRWASLNQHGRIILISDGKKDFKPLIKENSSMHQSLKEFSVKMALPIFIVKATRNSHTNSFIVPPEPGIVAFLQTRHFIDLRRSVYIIETTEHMKVAQAAGVKFVKSNKAVRYPEKALSSLCVIPPTPSMLRDMSEVKGEVMTSGAASLPLLEKCVDSGCEFASQIHPCGLQELVFVPDVTEILNIQENFASMVTPTDMPGSKMGSKAEEAFVNENVTGTSKTREISLGECKKEGSIQRLPVWMTRRLKRKSTDSSLSGVESDELESSFKFTKTIYLMSEKELKEMAIQVMKQRSLK